MNTAETNRTIAYLKSINKWAHITLPKNRDINPRTRRGDINLLTYKDYKAYHDEVCRFANVKKHVIFEDEETVNKLCNKIRARSPLPFQWGMVHGARNGKFTNWLFESLGIPIKATELSPAVSSMHSRTLEGGWDFHEVQKGWLNRFDFIWSSSFFHSYDPYLCIQRWMSTVKRNANGQCILLHHAYGSAPKAVERDIPFGANLGETICLINAAGRDPRNKGKNFHVETVWGKQDGVSEEKTEYKQYIVVVPTLTEKESWTPKKV